MLGIQISSARFYNGLVSRKNWLEVHLTHIEQGVQKIQQKEWNEALQHLETSERSSTIDGLIQLTTSLQNLSQNEKTRDWINQGLLELSRVINNNPDNLEELASQILRALVKHTGANQGMFFTREGDTNDELTVLACYAHYKKDFQDKRFGPGDSLVGQCFQGGDPMVLNNVPRDYVKIKSGLGAALPRCVILLPLKTNDKKIGVIELAYFKTLERQAYEFLLAACETIAKAILNHNNHLHVIQLLADSKNMATALKENESQLKQTIAEMETIQRDLNEKNAALEKTSKEIEDIRLRENEMIESKLHVQQLIHEKIVSKLKSKIDSLNSSLNPISVHSISGLSQLN